MHVVSSVCTAPDHAIFETLYHISDIGGAENGNYLRCIAWAEGPCDASHGRRDGKSACLGDSGVVTLFALTEIVCQKIRPANMTFQ